MTTEISVQDQVQNKMLTALIDAASVSNPSLKDRVTVAAVWQYLRLPDASFGWVPRLNPGEAPPPLPPQCKALCIITTLALGLTPGLGHVLWLGNKCFIDVYGKRVLAHRADGLKMLKRTIRPFTEGERTMFGLGEHDRHLVLEQTFERGSHVVEGVGYGIIDSTEFSSGKKPGLQTRKDTAMTLITRAERDFYNRYFPVDGIADMPENPREYADQLEPAAAQVHDPAKTIELMAQSSAPLQTPVDEAARIRHHNAAIERYDALAADVIAAGGSVSEILGQTLQTDVLENADEVNDAGDVLEAWLDANKPPEPPPPAGEKKGRGRPKKPKETSEAPTAPAEPPATVAHGVQPEYVEESLGEAVTVRDDEADDVLADETGPVRESDMAGPGDAWEPPIQPASPPTVTAAAPPVKSWEEQKADDRKRAFLRVTKAMSRIHEQGGATPELLGYDPWVRLNDRGAQGPELDAIAEILEAWAPGKLSPFQKANAARNPPPPTSPNPSHVSSREPPPDIAPPIGRPAAAKPPAAAPAPRPAATAPAPAGAKPTTVASTTAGKGIAYDMIARTLQAPADMLPEGVRVRLTELRGLFLQPSDHLRLPKAIREARGGAFRELDELIASRRGPVK